MEPIFDLRKAASIIKQHQIEQLHKLQQRILIVERFGEHAVTVPMLGSMGHEDLSEMVARHAELVEQIETLKEALDAASEADLMAFVQSINRRNRHAG